MSAVEQLRTAERELAERNAELVAMSVALDAQRRRYRRLFDRAPLAHLTTDTRGRIVEANTAAGEMLQVDAPLLPGKRISAFVLPEERRRFQRWFLQAASGERDVFTLLRRPGIKIDAELRVFRDEASLAWVIRDVTEERRARMQILELNRRLEQRVAEQAGEIETVYDQLPVGVAIVDAADGTVRRLNRRGRELLDGSFPFQPQVERALRGESVRGTGVPVRERLFEVTAAPVRGSGGEVTTVVLTFDDATERARIDRADREFVSNASHQLRTPITAIASAVAALKAGADEDPVERARFLDHVEMQAERLSRIVDAMLVLSRAQRRELDAPLTLLRVGPLLERLVSEATPLAGVAVLLDCDEGIAVIAHPALLEEAIASVLANAVEHTTSGSITVSAYEREDRVAIEIADTGPGMSPEVRERAFERFFGSAPNRRSAGLGLAIAAAAAQACRGTVELFSEQSRGTRVRFLLPGAPLLEP